MKTVVIEYNDCLGVRHCHEYDVLNTDVINITLRSALTHAQHHMMSASDLRFKVVVDNDFFQTVMLAFEPNLFGVTFFLHYN